MIREATDLTKREKLAAKIRGVEFYSGEILPFFRRNTLFPYNIYNTKH